MSTLPKILLTFTLAAFIGGGLGRFLRPAKPIEALKPAEDVPLTVKQQLTDKAFLFTEGKANASLAMADRQEFIQSISKLESESDLLAKLKEIERLTNGPEQDARKQLLAYRFVDLKLAGKVIQREFAGDSPFATVLMQAWAVQAPDTFRTWLQAFATTNNSLAVAGSNILRQQLQNTATLKFASELAMTPTGRTHEHRMAVFQSAMREATKDPQKALEAALTLPELLRIHALSGVAKGWAKNDITGALAWAKAIPDAKERHNALSSICQIQLESDPKAAAETLKLIPATLDIVGGAVHGAFASKLAETDPKAAAAHVLSLGYTFPMEEMLCDCVLPHMKELNLRSLSEVFSGIDPKGRMQSFTNLTNIPIGLASTLVQWNPPNPQGLLKEATELPASEAKSTIMNYLAWRLVKEDPAQAVELAAGMTGTEKERILVHALNASSQTADLAVMKSALEQVIPSQKAALVDMQVATLTKLFPNKAKDYIAALPEGERHIAAAKTVASLATFDPEAAFALGEALPADKKLDHLFAVGRAWAGDDPAAATQWANSLPAGSPEQQQAVHALAESLNKPDPAAAFQWSQKLTDRASMLSNLTNNYYEWIYKDSHAAMLAVQKAGLSPMELSQVLTPPETWTAERAAMIEKSTNAANKVSPAVPNQ